MVLSDNGERLHTKKWANGIGPDEVVKDVLLFPFVWRSYDQDRHTDANTMIGLRGIVKDRLAPSGYIEVHGELWRAEVMEGAPFVESGGDVRVKGIRGLTLIVQPNE
jgi:membrane protein implicated in regulation of membrane protease activity